MHSRRQRQGRAQTTTAYAPQWCFIGSLETLIPARLAPSTLRRLHLKPTASRERSGTARTRQAAPRNYRKPIPSCRQRGQSAGPSRPGGIFRKVADALRDVPVGDGSVGRAIKIAAAIAASSNRPHRPEIAPAGVTLRFGPLRGSLPRRERLALHCLKLSGFETYVPRARRPKPVVEVSFGGES